MNKDPIKCDNCGKFIAYDDIDNGAICNMITPDTEVSNECYETICKKCNSNE